jgi:hypothetical protein
MWEVYNAVTLEQTNHATPHRTTPHHTTPLHITPHHTSTHQWHQVDGDVELGGADEAVSHVGEEEAGAGLLVCVCVCVCRLIYMNASASTLTPTHFTPHTAPHLPLCTTPTTLTPAPTLTLKPKLTLHYTSPNYITPRYTTLTPNSRPAQAQLTFTLYTILHYTHLVGVHDLAPHFLPPPDRESYVHG